MNYKYRLFRHARRYLGHLLVTASLALSSHAAAEEQQIPQPPKDKFALAVSQFDLVLAVTAKIITTNIERENPSPTDILWETLKYVQNNSIHSVTEDSQEYAFQTPYVVKRMLLTNEGDKSKIPHLTCGPRAYAMREILKSFRIHSRLVQIYSDNYDGHEAHRFLEVYHPLLRRWEIWDPDYGVVYMDKTSRQPVDVMTMLLATDKHRFIPVGIGKEGWEETKTARIRDNYFEAVLFEDNVSGLKDAEIIVNADLFDIHRVFPGSGKTFKQWARDNYAFPRIIELRSSTHTPATLSVDNSGLQPSISTETEL